MRTLQDWFRLWFSLSVPVDRKLYFCHGLGLMAFKYLIDSVYINLVTGRRLFPLTYASLNPNAYPPPFKSYPTLTFLTNYESDWVTWVLVVWTLPFLWIGASMTLRRALDAGKSPWLSLLFFVPFVNYV